MKRHLLLGFIILLMSSVCFAGQTGTYGYFYKPSLGASGVSEKNQFDAGLDNAEAHLGRTKILGDPNYTTLSAALTTIGSDNVQLVIPSTAGEVTLGSTTTIPANVQLVVRKGAYFTLGNYDLTINGPYDAGLYKTFNTAGSGVVSFGSGAVSEVFPEWWGALGNGSADDTDAVNAAKAAALSGKTWLRFTAGKAYAIDQFLIDTDDTKVYAYGSKLIHNGNNKALLKVSPAGGKPNTVQNCEWHGGILVAKQSATNPTTDVMFVEEAWFNVFKDVVIFAGQDGNTTKWATAVPYADYGLRIYGATSGGTYYNTFDRFYIFGSNEAGIKFDGIPGERYLELQETNLSALDIGNYVRGVTSGAVGLIVYVDDTNDIVYLDSKSGSTLNFSTSEQINETTDGTPGGDTGSNFTNDASTAYTNSWSYVNSNGFYYPIIRGNNIGVHVYSGDRNSFHGGIIEGQNTENVLEEPKSTSMWYGTRLEDADYDIRAKYTSTRYGQSLFFGSFGVTPSTESTGKFLTLTGYNYFRSGGRYEFYGPDAQLSCIGPVSTTTTYRTQVTGDTGWRFVQRAEGDMRWGDSTGSLDVSLFRASANVLQLGSGDALRLDAVRYHELSSSPSGVVDGYIAYDDGTNWAGSGEGLYARAGTSWFLLSTKPTVRTLGDVGYATLSAAVTTIGSTETTLTIPREAGAVAVSSNITIPNNIRLKVEQGAYFNISDGVTLTMNATVDAGHYKIFQWSGTGRVTFGGAYGKNPVVSFAWWGPPEGTGNDCTAYFKRCVEGLNTRNTLFIPQGVWRITSTIDWEDLDGTPGGNCNSMSRIIGAGQQVSNIYIDVGNTNNGIEFGTDESGYALYFLYLRDLSFVGPADACKNGVVFKKCHGMDIDRTEFWMGAEDYAVVIQGSCVTMNDCNIRVRGSSTYTGPDNGVKMTRNTGDSYAINAAQYRFHISCEDSTESAPMGLYIDGEEDYVTGQWHVGNPLKIEATIENCGNGYPIYAEYVRRAQFNEVYATDGNNNGLWFQGCRIISCTNLHVDGLTTLFDNCQGVTLDACDFGTLLVKANCEGFSIGNIEISSTWGLQVETDDVTWTGTAIKRDDAAMPRYVYNTSGPNRQNFMHNTGFTRWKSDRPEGWNLWQNTWTKCGTGESDTTKHLLDYCAKFVTSGGNGSAYYVALNENTSLLKLLLGREVCFSMWVKMADGMVFSDYPYIRFDTTNPTWASSTAYVVGDYVQSSGSTKWFKCITAGTSGGSEPTWDTNYGRKTTDNTVVWQKVHSQPEGRSNIALPLTAGAVGKWVKLTCRGFVPNNATDIKFGYVQYRQTGDSESTCYLAEPCVTIGSLPAAGHIVGQDEHLDWVMVGGKKLSWGSATPTSGWWDTGDVRINTSPTVGDFVGWICTTSGSQGTWKKFGNSSLQGSASWEPQTGSTGTLDADDQDDNDFTVTGAVIGDYAIASPPEDLQSCSLSAYVSASNTVTVVVRNETGSGINFSGGTWKVRVLKSE